MKRKTYEQVPYVIQNAIDLCETAEFLQKNGRSDKAFIFASYAIEELGKSFILLNKSFGRLPSTKTNNHNEKAQTFDILSALFTFIFHNISPLNVLVEELLWRIKDAVSRIDTQGLTQGELFSRYFAAINNVKDELKDKFKDAKFNVVGIEELEREISESLFQDRNTLLYVDGETALTPEERWKSVLSRSRIAQQVDIGDSVFNQIRFLCDMVGNWSKTPLEWWEHVKD